MKLVINFLIYLKQYYTLKLSQYLSVIAIQSIDSKLLISLQLKNSIQIQVTFFTEIEIANKKSMIFPHVPFSITSFLVYQFKNINSSINADKPTFWSYF